MINLKTAYKNTGPSVQVYIASSMLIFFAHSDVMVPKTHGAIIPRYQVHGTVFIAVFKNLKKTNQDLEKNATYYYPVFL